MTSLERFFCKNEEGVSSVEYAIIVSLIAAVIIGTVIILGGEVLGLYASVDGQF